MCCGISSTHGRECGNTDFGSTSHVGILGPRRAVHPRRAPRARRHALSAPRSSGTTSSSTAPSAAPGASAGCSSPLGSDLAGTLAAFATLAVGFLVPAHRRHRLRPLRRPDRPQAMLVITLLLMGVATVAIGLLPNDAAIGVVAPILLVALRFVQGLAVGGEWGGAVALADRARARRQARPLRRRPADRRPAGVLAGGPVPADRGSRPTAFLAWGWRIPFLFSVVLIVASAISSGSPSTSPRRSRRSAPPVAGGRSAPLRLLVTQHPPKTVLQCALIFVGSQCRRLPAHRVPHLRYATRHRWASTARRLLAVDVTGPRLRWIGTTLFGGMLSRPRRAGSAPSRSATRR